MSDLLVELDDRLRKVIVDVGCFLGVGAEPVALDIGQPRRRGNGGDPRASLTGEQPRAPPRHERGSESYHVQGRGG